MKVTVTYEVDDAIAKYITETSVERVINEAIRILEEVDEEDSQGSDASNNLADWDDCKRHVVHLWDAIRDGIFRARNNDMKQVRDWVV